MNRPGNPEQVKTEVPCLEKPSEWTSSLMGISLFDFENSMSVIRLIAMLVLTPLQVLTPLMLGSARPLYNQY